jgi:hypothetical protein
MAKRREYKLISKGRMTVSSLAVSNKWTVLGAREWKSGFEGLVVLPAGLRRFGCRKGAV